MPERDAMRQMMTASEEIIDPQERDRQWVMDFLGRKVGQAREQYDKALNRLWLGNSGGVTLSITHLAHSKQVGLEKLFPMAIFLVGLLALSFGAIWDLCWLRRSVLENEAATGPLSIIAGRAKRPHEQAWSKCSHVTTITALVLFGLGCLCGVLVAIRDAVSS